MYDSTNVDAIPLSATLVLVYLDGKYVTDLAAAIRFPHAQRIPTTTTTLGDLAAQIYDCEKGDGDPQQAAAWAKRKLSLSQRPTIYCNLSTWPSVKTALTTLGIGLQQVDFGIADWTGHSHLIPGSAFTQYANPPSSGGDYDLSITNGVWPNEPEPSVLAKPAVEIIGTKSDNGYWIVAADGGVFAYGDAVFFGSLPSRSIVPAAPIVSMEVTTTQLGYRLLGSDGGVFCFGDAMFYGAANTA